MSSDLPIDEPAARPARKPFWRDLTIRGMMAIVAALSLLFAAISYQARMGRRKSDVARRTACVHNLKQIGLALATYAERQGSYPTGSVASPHWPVDRRLGWMDTLIPFLDLPHLVEADPIDRPWDDPSFHDHNHDSAWGPVVCPSMGKPPGPRSANYVGIAGLGIDAPTLPKGHARAGVFGDHRVTSPADITDGLGQTMMVAESSVPAGPWFAGGRNTVRGLDPALQPYIGEGRQFGGLHAEGANVLMADGSVHFLRATVAPKVFEAMSTIAGGEKVSAP